MTKHIEVPDAVENTIHTIFVKHIIGLEEYALQTKSGPRTEVVTYDPYLIFFKRKIVEVIYGPGEYKKCTQIKTHAGSYHTTLTRQEVLTLMNAGL